MFREFEFGVFHSVICVILDIFFNFCEEMKSLSVLLKCLVIPERCKSFCTFWWKMQFLTFPACAYVPRRCCFVFAITIAIVNALEISIIALACNCVCVLLICETPVGHCLDRIVTSVVFFQKRFFYFLVRVEIGCSLCVT